MKREVAASFSDAYPIVTPDSDRPYQPIILANGADAVLLGYTGSMASGLTGHAHLEQHQGVMCGWYKPAHAGHLQLPMRQLPLLVESGYQIIVNDEVCDIQDYQQQFNPKQATLVSRIHARGAMVEIESFLTQGHTLVERYRILKTPRDARVSFALYVRPQPAVMGGLWGINQPTVKTRVVDDATVSLSYQIQKIRGGGVMQADRPAHGPYGDFPGLLYQDVRAGFTVTKFLTLMDQTDHRSWKRQLQAAQAWCVDQGHRGLKHHHHKQWAAYFNQHTMTLPDAWSQYLYDFSQYFLRGCQSPVTGAITCGPMPCHWAGGVHVPYDAWFGQEALLRTNHLEQGREHVKFHRDRYPSSRMQAQDAGLSGAIYSGWCDMQGKHLGLGSGRNWKDYLLKYKPLMPAYLVLDACRLWEMDPADPAHVKNLPYMKAILDLAVAFFIVQTGDHATMAPCMAGNESAVMVQNDTLNGLAYAVALQGYARMAQSLTHDDGEPYATLGRQLMAGVERNRKKGVLLPYDGAKYLAGLQLDFYLTTLPDRTDKRSIDATIQACATRWGLDTDQPSEAYRDWPWFNSRAAIAYAHLGDHAKAFHWLMQSARYASALGALPEKIRLDGYAIGYGYMTAHALYVWSVAHALAHDGPADQIALLYGLDGQWRDLQAQNLRLKDGLLLTINVKDSQLTQLELRNTTDKAITRTLALNDAYKGAIPRSIVIPARQTISGLE